MSIKNKIHTSKRKIIKIRTVKFVIVGFGYEINVKVSTHPTCEFPWIEDITNQNVKINSPLLNIIPKQLSSYIFLLPINNLMITKVICNLRNLHTTHAKINTLHGLWCDPSLGHAPHANQGSCLIKVLHISNDWQVSPALTCELSWDEATLKLLCFGGSSPNNDGLLCPLIDYDSFKCWYGNQ